MKQKKILIFSIIALILVLLLLILRQHYGNIQFRRQMQSVKKDIVIEECYNSNEFSVSTVITYNYYYVDLEKQTIYHVENIHDTSGKTFFLDNKGNHYTLKGKKVLTSSEIADILRLTTLPSDSITENYNSNYSDTNLINNSPSYNYYNITYNGKTKSLSESTVSSFIQIVNDI